MNRREFIQVGAGGAVAALAGCVTAENAGSKIQNIRAESAEMQA